MSRLIRSHFFWLSCCSLVVLVVFSVIFARTRGAAAQERTAPATRINPGRAVTDGPVTPELPNYDAFTSNAAARARRATARRTPQFEGGRLVQMEPLLDVPTFLWGQDAATPAPSVNVPWARRFSRADVESSARRHLQRYAGRYRLTDKDVSDVQVSQVHDTGRGGIIVKFKQVFGGVEVFREQITVAMNRQLELVALTGFVTGAAERDAETLRFAESPNRAIAAALSDLTGAPVTAAAVRSDAAMNRARRDTPYEYFQTAPNAQLKAKPLQPMRGRKVIFHLVGKLVPAYYLEAEVEDPNAPASSRYYAYVISAADGEMLYRKNLTSDQTYTYRVWADGAPTYRPLDGPIQDFTPHPTGLPDGSSASFIAPSLVSLQNFPFSQNDPWLPANATETQGNNVDAYADHNLPDGFSAGDYRATPTSPGVFDRTYDTSLEPDADQDQVMASITQLFYVNNFLHDWFYDHGFNEASGNAQQDNLGRGGLGGDRLKAEAQDTRGVNLNNANMSTPADGAPPRMQMYLWQGATTSSLTVNSANYQHSRAEFGPANFNFTGDLILADDQSTVTTNPTPGTFDDACQPLVGSGYPGKIILARRGACNFTVKAANAQAAGAIGLIVFNNVVPDPPPMGGTDPSITIGVLGISLADGNTVLSQLQSGTVSATMVRTAEARRDGTIDNQIVAHEWGHFIHHRLTNTGNNQGGGMSEGWGDFLSMLLTVREGDNYDGVYGMGGYALSGVVPNSNYFGIRRYPYSTDLIKSPLTFKHIQNGVSLPAGVPVSNSGSPDNAEVHNAGELWAVVLWECYAALLKDNSRLTFAEAQNRMLSYVVAGLKLTPNDATFTEGRDAILLAAYLNDPVDFQLFTQAFAKRGMGLKAVSPARASTNHAGVVEDFNSGGALAFAGAALDDSISSCDNDGVLDNLETGKLTVTLLNNGWAMLNNTTATISSPTPGVSFPNGATINFPASNFSGMTASSVNVTVTGLTGIQVLTFNISFSDPGTAMPGPMMATYSVRVNTDELPNSTKTDDVESRTPVWTASNDVLGNSTNWARKENSPLSHHWLGPDESGVSDHSLISPALQVAGSGDFVINFSHRFQFESDATADWDGGVIEISTNNGMTWTDIGSLIGAGGYNGTIGDPAAGNPLLGRNGFVAQSASYPAFQPVTLNLGTAYAGQTVKIRFRIGTDEAAGANGWEIDDIAFTGITNMPFAQVVAGQAAGGTLNPASGALPAGTLGVNYSQQFLVNGASSNSITVANGSSLPPGLSLSGTGLLSGTPSAVGSYQFTLQATGSCATTITATYTLQVNCDTIAINPASLPAIPAGAAYSQQLTVTGALGSPVNFAVTSGALPTGMTLSPSGMLSGTPTEVGSFSFQITATGSGAFASCGGSRSYSVTVVCPTITLTPATLPNAVQGIAYNQTIGTTPAGSFTLSVSNGLLPAGLTLNSNGSFSGAPTQSGTFNFRVTVGGLSSCSVFRDYVLIVECSAITVAPASLPGGTVGTEYSQTVAASPASSYSYSVSSGALPPGLSLNASTGAITGTPAASSAGGSFSFTVTATAGSCSGSRTYTVAIACPAITLSPTSPLPGSQAGAAYSQTISASPAGSYTFSLVSGSLPSGLTLNPATGVISGLPSTVGSFTFTVKAQTASGCSGTQTYTQAIICPTVTFLPASLPNGTTGTAYSQTISASPAGGSYAYAVTTGSLPTGLNLNSGTGVLSGTPTTAGSFAFRITATGFGGCTGFRDYTVVIGGGGCPAITLPDIAATGSIGSPYNQSVAASPSGYYTYALTGTTPPGVAFYSGAALIFGYPTANGTFNFTITATNSSNCTGSKSYNVTVGAGFARAVVNDFDGDGKSDPVVWHGKQSQWEIANSSDGKQQIVPLSEAFDSASDVMAYGDYDGDGNYDLAFYRRATSQWLIRASKDGEALTEQWGIAGDVPVPADYDGDGKADLAVWRESEGAWHIRHSSDGQTRTELFGGSGALFRDVPVPADYDGDGKADIAIFRQGIRQGGHWYIKQSSDGAVVEKELGLIRDVPVVADYDGDGKADIAVWRGSLGLWHIIRSSDGAADTKAWGASYSPYFDTPAVGDYDGDGKADLAVWRKSEGRWYVLQSSDGATRMVSQSEAGDQPVTGRP